MIYLERHPELVSGTKQKLKVKDGYVYIMSNLNRTTFYIGVTSNLKTRIADHKDGIGSEFTTKYKLTDLIYHVEFPDIYQSIDREKQLKKLA